MNKDTLSLEDQITEVIKSLTCYDYQDMEPEDIKFVENIAYQKLKNLVALARQETIQGVITSLEERNDAGNYKLGMVYDAICYFKEKLSSLKERKE